MDIDSLFLESLKNVRVLVIGDMMLDHYLWGDVHRISPEAPVPVVHAARDTYSAGGAATVALNLASLGVSTSILGYIGTDDAGKRLDGILSERGIILENITSQSEVPTIIKTRVIIRNQQLCRIDREVSRDQYRLDILPGFFEKLDALLNNTDAVIISDYAKGVITQPLVDFLLDRSKKPLFIAVDPKPANNIFYRGANLLSPNRAEALQLAGISQLSPGEKYPLEEVCKAIHKHYYPKLLVITLGAGGMAICEKGRVVQILPTEAREVFDVSGAGDTVIATLTAALATGFNPIQAAWVANGAAGCVVAHIGTVPVSKTELSNWLNTHQAQSKKG
jgi:rfaE bifunctional protein kinase chain/domain